MSTLADYEPWAQGVLQALQAGNVDSIHTAETILSTGIPIIIDRSKEATNLWWKVRAGWKGPKIENGLYVSGYIAGRPPEDAWVLMEFIHETRHLEQGFWTAFSVYGEFEAWQLGFRFYQTCANAAPLGPALEQLLALPLCHDRNVVKQAQALINQYENAGTSLKEQVRGVMRKEMSFSNIYWINALPLNPLF